MIQHLIRKCPRCKNVVKLTLEDGKIIRLIGAEQPRINLNYSGGRSRYATDKFDKSQKTVCCTAKNIRHLSGWASCWQAMLVRSFKEIKI